MPVGSDEDLVVVGRHNPVERVPDEGKDDETSAGVGHRRRRRQLEQPLLDVTSRRRLSDVLFLELQVRERSESTKWIHLLTKVDQQTGSTIL